MGLKYPVLRLHSLPWIHRVLPDKPCSSLGSTIDLCALVYFSTQGGSPTTSFLASIQTFWYLYSWTLPVWLALGIPGCQGSWGTAGITILR